jgi:hypothetical protein
VLGFVLVGSAALGTVVGVQVVSGATPALEYAPALPSVALRLTLPAPPLLEWVQQYDHQARQRRG